MKTVHIVYGPPLAGKSTFVRENMGPDDLVFDMRSMQIGNFGKSLTA